MFADQAVKDVVSLFQARSDKTRFKSYVDEHGKDIHEIVPRPGIPGGGQIMHRVLTPLLPVSSE